MKNKEEKKLTKDQAEKKILLLKDLKKLIIKLQIQRNILKLREVLLDYIQLLKIQNDKKNIKRNS